MLLITATSAALLCAVCAIVFALVNFYSVKRMPEGTKQMADIAGKIRKGAMAYLSRQYKTVAVFFAVLFVIFIILAAAGAMSWFAPFAFVTGGFFSALAVITGPGTASPEEQVQRVFSSPPAFRTCESSVNYPPLDF